jgi:hypothetical protein
MATWIVHLRIAEQLLSRIIGLDESYFSMGNIAPDSGIPDEKWEKFDPPPKILHFMQDDPAAPRCSDLDFYRRYLEPLSQWKVSDQNFAFRLGYFFHLITDNLWDRTIGIPTQNRFKFEFDADPKFIWEVKRDWYGLDFEYVRRQPESLFWRVFLNCSYNNDFLDFLPARAVAERVDYIQKFYQRRDERIEDWYIKRPGIYLSEKEMNDFLSETVEFLLKTYQYIQNHPTLSENHSVLELNFS